ncbi:hypothetical protein G7046_g6080 [Stylonectria norvegica]|nr:hypothetical protein G7046_g6080 [Stylonectria norvegica]
MQLVSSTRAVSSFGTSRLTIDADSTKFHISDALRDLTIDHTNSYPFQKHYLGRDISADLWGILCGQTPQKALLKQARGIGHSISKRRPIYPTEEQMTSISTDPCVMGLARQLQLLRKGFKEKMNGHRRLRNLKERQKTKHIQKTRDDWPDEQAVDDIEREVRGEEFAKPVAAVMTCRPQEPAQKRLTDAINGIVAYYGVKAGGTIRHVNIPNHIPVTTSCTPLYDSPLSLATTFVFVENDKERPKTCFLCICIAHFLDSDEPRVADLIHEIYTSGDLVKHFRRRHLLWLQGNAKPECYVCDLSLDNKMHLQNHVLKFYGVVS